MLPRVGACIPPGKASPRDYFANVMQSGARALQNGETLAEEG